MIKTPLRPCPPPRNTWGTGSIPGQGTKILPPTKNKEKEIDKIISDIDKKHKEINQGDVQVRATSTVRTN